LLPWWRVGPWRATRYQEGTPTSGSIVLAAGLGQAEVAGAADAGDVGGLAHGALDPCADVYRAFHCWLSCPARAAATASTGSLISGVSSTMAVHVIR